MRSLILLDAGSFAQIKNPATYTPRFITVFAVLVLALTSIASNPATSQTKTYEGALGIPFVNEIRANETKAYFEKLLPLVKAARGERKSPDAKDMIERFKNQKTQLSQPGAQAFPDEQAYSVAVQAADELFKGYVRSDRLGFDYLFSDPANAKLVKDDLKSLEERLAKPGVDKEQVYRDISANMTSLADILKDSATKTLDAPPAVTAEDINLTVPEIMRLNPKLTKAQAERKLAEVRQKLLENFKAISAAKR
jgi:hypothetical protein